MISIRIDSKSVRSCHDGIGHMLELSIDDAIRLHSRLEDEIYKEIDIELGRLKNRVKADNLRLAFLEKMKEDLTHGQKKPTNCAD